jgi:hypothetical protein
MPLMMPFVQGILFGMHLVNSKARDSGSMLFAASLLRGSHHGSNLNGDNCSIAVVAATAIKEVGCLSSCYVLLNLCHHLSFQNPKKLEAVLMVDTIVLLALIPLETMTALHLVHGTITALATTA